MFSRSRDVSIIVLTALIWVLVCSAVPESVQTNCSEIKSHLDKERETLRKLNVVKMDLDSQFSESVQRDMARQAEGLLDEIHRNKALKVSYARKKLSRRIESIKAMITKFRQSYCESCFYERGDESAKQANCGTGN